MFRRTAVTLAAVASLAVSATGAAAAGPIMGNDAVDAISWASTNTLPNARVDDTPATTDGVIRSIRYWAKTTGWAESGTIQFIVVDPTGLVTWVSDPVTAAPGVSEARELTLPNPVGVTTGSLLGITMTDGPGVVAANLAPGPSFYTSLTPIVVGTQLTGGVPDWLQLSMNAEVLPAGPATKDACKDDGFTAYGFDNQGACIASLMAAEQAGKG